MTILRAASSVALSGRITKTQSNRLAALAPVCLVHAAGLILLVVTERSIVGAGVFLLAWTMLNCLGLALVRRPTLAALISLEILLALTLLSRFKFDKLWMTVDFVDVMIIDRDTTAFLLAILPSFRFGGSSNCRRCHHRLAARLPSHQAARGRRRVRSIGRGAGDRVAALAYWPDRRFRRS